MKKRCFKCGKVRLLSQFYPHPRMADGHLNKCKRCAIQDSAKAYDPRRRAVYEKSPGRKARKMEMQRERRLRYPGKARARSAVSNAIRDGRLVRPTTCDSCGVACKPQAHHDDYRKSFAVRWMCFKCHRERGHGQKVVTSVVV